jgi:hypothetical protein
MYAQGPLELQTDGIGASTMEELAEIVASNLAGKRNLAMVCGAITTGGTGNQVHNFEIFNAVIRGLERRGRQMFNQIPYEFGLRKLAHKWEEEGNKGYCMPILTVFYDRVFKSGAISEGFFIPGWYTSTGASWERSMLTETEIEIRDFTRLEIKTLLMAEYPLKHVKALMRLLPR